MNHQGVSGPPPPAPVLWRSRQLFEIRHQIVLLKPLAGVMLIAPQPSEQSVSVLNRGNVIMSVLL